MSVLAHVFEAAGLATVVLASMRDVVARMAPPRALYAEFPLGRPLGKPNDAAFQRDVLTRAFDLLAEPAGPVLADHPEPVVADETPVSCRIPAAYDPDLHPAVAEVRGLASAFARTRERRGVTSVGRVIDADRIEEGIAVLRRLADGEPWKSVDIPGKSTTALVHDVRTYYEEAALSLVDTADLDGRALEAWFYEQTAAGELVMAARSSVRDQEAPGPVWFYMAPGHR